jgi:hypothetical protein
MEARDESLRRLDENLTQDGHSVMARLLSRSHGALIDSGEITATLILSEVPRENWRDLMVARSLFLKTKLSLTTAVAWSNFAMTPRSCTRHWVLHRPPT